MWNILLQLRKNLPPRLKYRAVWLLAFMVLSALLELAGLAMLMPAVTAFADPASLESASITGRLYRWSTLNDPETFIVFSAAAVVIFYLIKNLISLVMVRCQSRFSMELTNDVAKRLFRNYISAPYETYSNLDTSALTVQVNRVHDFISQLILPLMFIGTELCVFAVIAGAVFVLEPLIATFVAVTALTALLLFYLPVKKRQEAYGERNHKASGELLTLLKQVFGSLDMIRLNQSESYFTKCFEQTQNKRSLSQKQASDIGQTPRFAMETFGILLAMCVVILIVLSDRTFQEAAAGAAFFIAALIRLMPSVSRIQYNLLQIRGAKYLFEQICSDLSGFPHEHLQETDKAITFDRAVTVEQLTLSYGCNAPVLKDFNFTIHPRESVALTGKTGSGKTTLIHLIMGFLTPDAGKICTDGTDIQENMGAWRKMIGYVPQTIYLLNTSIRENIAFGVPPEKIDDEKVRKAVEMAQIGDFVKALPDGIYTGIGENGSRLSGGQKQRIAIARALYNDPHLLILDEATSALDPGTEKAFVDALDSLRGKVTILMIAHRLSSTAHCDRTVQLGD